ncbi:HipA domain-containing protein [Curvibacter gracilis]|uniref:HipA domain-containing protein n=1 Tax=Curvibacter gracilis TaxID=230310 RepID=UPI0004839E2A|nr:HipA domain-containing protein [Curvibacter gracilis]
MNKRVLQVLINGDRVGTLIDEGNVWGFQYAKLWLTQPQPFPLSPALPLGPDFQRDGSTVRPVQWFFDNLLPEEALREAIGNEEGIAAADAFGLLERLGAESAGALVLQPEGAPEAPKGTQQLTYSALSERIRRLPVSTLNRQAPKRMSLAGAQHKMVVCFDPVTGTLKEPLKGTPSSHILKPNSTAVGYPHSVVNEVFTMRLAALLGLRVPPVWRVYVPEPVYLIERFDRVRGPTDLELLRVHALDGSQALNESGVYKYSSATFQKLLQLIGLCRNKAVARLEVFRWILFNTLVGNSDCHLKNISFLIDTEGMRVAPFYDLLCTAVYHTRALDHHNAVWPDEDLAMPVAAAVRFGEVTQPKLVETGMQLGLSAATARREVSRMVTRLAGAADELIDVMAAEYKRLPLLAGASAETQGAELHLLRSIRHVVIEDMLRLVK